jgi:hypothetical protein
MNQRRAVEELAKKRGVVLAGMAPAVAPPTVEPTQSTGWMARLMPVAAPMMAELKAQLPPEIWKGAMDMLRRGGGYVIDESTNLAMGRPPVDLWQRGKIDTRDGFTVMRVRRIESPQR